jgi:hypothetical protein
MGLTLVVPAVPVRRVLVLHVPGRERPGRGLVHDGDTRGRAPGGLARQGSARQDGEAEGQRQEGAAMAGEPFRRTRQGGSEVGGQETLWAVVHCGGTPGVKEQLLQIGDTT